MRFLLIFLATTAVAQPRLMRSNTTESLRGVSTVSRQIAWASGTHGAYLRTTDAGEHWQPAQVPGAETLDFRAVVAFSADEAFLMSAGPGDQSRIYHTADAGQHWQLQFTNANPKGFFDSMVFWDRTHGLVLGDPIPDESGKLKFELLQTEDGQTWKSISSLLPPALEGEGAFAASNSCLAIISNAVILSADSRFAKRRASRSRRIPITTASLASSLGVLPMNPRVSVLSEEDGQTSTGMRSPAEPSQNKSSPRNSPDPDLWFATGGKAARVFHSSDHGQTWTIVDTPILHGPDSAGIFSIAFKDATHGVIAGGDYKHPDQDGPNLAFTQDGGKTWTLSTIHPQAYFSAVAYDRRPTNAKQNESKDRIYLVAPNFIFDFRPPRDPTRINASKKSPFKFNAVAPYPEGGALFVGPNGTIAVLP